MPFFALFLMTWMFSVRITFIADAIENQNLALSLTGYIQSANPATPN
jgi:hypothetical protein